MTTSTTKVIGTSGVARWSASAQCRPGPTSALRRDRRCRGRVRPWPGGPRSVSRSP